MSPLSTYLWLTINLINPWRRVITDAGSRSVGREISWFLWNPNCDSRVSKSSTPVPVLSHSNPINTQTFGIMKRAKYKKRNILFLAIESWGIKFPNTKKLYLLLYYSELEQFSWQWPQNHTDWLYGATARSRTLASSHAGAFFSESHSNTNVRLR